MRRRIAPRAGTARKEEIIVRKVMGDVGLRGLMIVMGCASASSVKVTGRKFLGAGVIGSGFHGEMYESFCCCYMRWFLIEN
jgi:hypothetical protein